MKTRRFEFSMPSMIKPMLFILKIVCGVTAGFTQHLVLEGNASILDMDTTHRSPNNLVRMEDGTLAIKQVQIGDTSFGGIVFYVDPTGEHGLVMAENDQSNSMVWNDSTSEIGSTSDGVYGGMANTNIILSAHKSGNYAARLCFDLDINGYTDWYLPSYKELVLINQNLYAIGVGNLTEGPGEHYWSSTEFSAFPSNARTIIFGDGTPYALMKFWPLNVRAIRRF